MCSSDLLTVDARVQTITWTYAGPDANVATADSPAPFQMQSYRGQDSFYGFTNVPWISVDRAYQRSLVERFELDPGRRFKEYSKGNKQKVGLIIALQHRPELLIFDEPTAGLDPLVQQTFFAILREAVAEGRTAFLSSHILSEVEKTCDRVAIIREGRLARVDRVESLRDLAHHQVELRFAGPVPVPVAEFEGLPGVSDVVAQGDTLRMRVAGPIAPVVRAAARYELLDFVSREPSLEETFLAEYGQQAVTVNDRGR